jgi:hypothetical protein
MIRSEDLTYADWYDLDALGDNAPLPPAYCDVYHVHDPHTYTAINHRVYSCAGMTAAELDELDALADAEPCPHGLSAHLCADPINHYPPDRYDY